MSLNFFTDYFSDIHLIYHVDIVIQAHDNIYELPLVDIVMTQPLPDIKFWLWFWLPSSRFIASARLIPRHK